jgi:CheY-like chemotaxis protein
MLRMHDPRALAGLRVLVVEDAEDIREIMTVLLRTEGAEVRAVGAGVDALEIAATWNFDVLLTDLGLPDVSGDRLIREILGLKGARPRVVVMTGYGEPHISRARQAGADAVFTKPLEWSVLRAQLRAPDEALAA